MAGYRAMPFAGQPHSPDVPVAANIRPHGSYQMRYKTFKLSLLTGSLVLGTAVALHVSGVALATPASAGFVSEILGRSFFERIRVNTGHGDDDVVTANLVKILARDPSDVYMVRNTVAPGAGSGWHTHPGPSIVMVTSGTASVYEGDDPSCTPVTVPAGTGFIDAGGTHVHLVRNAGATPLVTVAFQIIPTGAARRIDAPNPGNCQF
jgi:quercetin dioxygenase-like cupin family protein